MIKHIIVAVLLVSTAVAVRAKWVWVHCGYDCGIFAVTQGPASVVVWYLGLGGMFLSGIALAVSLVRRKGRKGRF